MTVEVDITGRRYLEDRDTAAVLAGSQVPRHQLHRALDAEPDRRRAAALADHGGGRAGRPRLAAARDRPGAPPVRPRASDRPNP